MSFAPSSPPTVSTQARPPGTPSTVRVMPTNVMNTPSQTSSSTPNANGPSTSTNAVPTNPENKTRERQGSFGGSSRIKALKPFNTANIKILLLENVNETAVSALRDQGYQVFLTLIFDFISPIKNWTFGQRKATPLSPRRTEM